MKTPDLETRVERHLKSVGFVAGPMLALGIYVLNPGGHPPEARRLLAVVTLVIVWWMSEALPLPATALLGSALAIAAGVLLAGVVVGSFFTAVIALILSVSEAQAVRSAVLWMMGSLAGPDWGDVLVVAAFGQILRRNVLDLPPHGCINIHASLLPRWRGAAPVIAAIRAGDTETGITLMRMDEGLDTGPVYAQKAIPIGPHDTAADLHDQLAELGAGLLAGFDMNEREGAARARELPKALRRRAIGFLSIHARSRRDSTTLLRRRRKRRLVRRRRWSADAPRATPNSGGSNHCPSVTMPRM